MPAEAGELRRRVEFRRRATDPANGGARTGPWVSLVTRDARIQPRFGGETFQAARMAGEQPVTITVRADSLTRALDNACAARDARDLTVVWDIRSAVLLEDGAWVEMLAVQRLAGDDDE